MHLDDPSKQEVMARMAVQQLTCKKKSEDDRCYQ